MTIPTRHLIGRILSGYDLEPRGIHGIVHWARVLENGLRIAEVTGADPEVVTLFAIFHDSRRVNDHRDDGHGRRGSAFARSIEHELGLADRARLDLLYDACDRHTDGLIEADLTVQACWDADRLDLPRVGIETKPSRLCTDAARALIPWARDRALQDFEPPVLLGWGS